MAATSTAANAASFDTLSGAAPIVIAHRGASGYLPEHTLAGYELAARMGVDYIEPDVQITSDGQLVAIHDSTLTRTTNVEALFAPRNGSYRVSDFTLAEIKTLTVEPVGTASTAYPGFTPVYSSDYKVPTLDEVLDLANRYNADNGTQIGVYPEAKAASSELNEKIVQSLAAHGFKNTAADKVYIQSFSIDALNEIGGFQAAEGTDIDLIALGSVNASYELGGLTLTELAAIVDGLGISLRSPGLTEEFIDLAHAAGLSVVGWTFSDPDPITGAEQYQKFIDWGMDGFFGNYPDIAVASVAANTPAAVPVPAPLGLAALGLAVVGGLARRKRQVARMA